MTSELPTLDQVDVCGKRVLVRCDFNVPLTSDGLVADDTRLVAALPTINELMSHGPQKIILCSHLGRPNGEVRDEFRLQPVARALEVLLSQPIHYFTDVVGDEVRQKIDELPQGAVCLLENVRFLPGETKGDQNLAEQFSSLADVFVLDAFGTAHRAHASVVGPTKHIPSVAGRLLEKEIKNLDKLIHQGEKPFVTIIGGAKVSDKVDVIKRLIALSDHILIGGAMAYTFLKAQGIPVGISLCEDDKIDLAHELLSQAQNNNCQIHLPHDHVCAPELSETAAVINSEGAVPGGYMGLDIGPITIDQYTQIVSQAKTLLWNGPMGVFELKPFAQGTKAIALAAAQVDAFSVVGGGDSVAAIEKFDLKDQFTHISTGGGASLEYISGHSLPGIEALRQKQFFA